MGARRLPVRTGKRIVFAAVTFLLTGPDSSSQELRLVGRGDPQAGASRSVFPPRIENAIMSSTEFTSQMMIVAQT